MGAHSSRDRPKWGCQSFSLERHLLSRWFRLLMLPPAVTVFQLHNLLCKYLSHAHIYCVTISLSLSLSLSLQSSRVDDYVLCYILAVTGFYAHIYCVTVSLFLSFFLSVFLLINWSTLLPNFGFLSSFYVESLTFLLNIWNFYLSLFFVFSLLYYFYLFIYLFICLFIIIIITILRFVLLGPIDASLS